MLQEQARRPRDYGGWRRQRGIGLWGLGTTGTFAVLATTVVVILVAAIDVRALIYVAPPVAVTAGLGLARVSGEPLALKALRRMRWQLASARGYTKYRVGVVTEHPNGFSLPGVLAPAALLSAEDGYGGRYGLVWDRRTGMLTPTLRVVPASTWLADRADADNWVANWGGWLASLGYMPMLRWVTVTIDTAPEPGSTLADAIAAAIAPSAPAAARQILGQLAAAAPAAAADVDTRVSLTFDPRACPATPRNLTEAAAETGRALIGLESALGTCGVSVLGRLAAAEIAGVVRTAFDPAARGEILRIAAQALARLVAPGPYPKRVSLQYRPFPAAAATRVLEAEVNAAAFRATYRSRTGRDETARDSHDQARARQAASEEAAGAGVCLISLFVTVTVTRTEDLPHAIAWTEASAESSKIRLRRMTYSQAAGFAATLPCGICPADLARRMPH